jgi:hypothetical protein
MNLSNPHFSRMWLLPTQNPVALSTTLTPSSVLSVLCLCFGVSRTPECSRPRRAPSPKDSPEVSRLPSSTAPPKLGDGDDDEELEDAQADDEGEEDERRRSLRVEATATATAYICVSELYIRLLPQKSGMPLYCRPLAFYSKLAL